MMGFQGSPKLGHSQELALGIIASGWLSLGQAFKRLPTGNQTVKPDGIVTVIVQEPVVSDAKTSIIALFAPKP